MELQELYNEVITDHNQSGHNRRMLKAPSIEIPGKNPSCGDEITLSLVVKDGVIVDGAYTGIGCAVSQASASIMLDLMRGKTLAEAEKLNRLFFGMVHGTALTQEEQEELDEAMVLRSAVKMPARVKCATMPWHTMETAVKELKGTPK